MMLPNETWLHRVVADLRDYASDLLGAGLAPVKRGGVSVQDGSLLQATLNAIAAFRKQVPLLLSDLDHEEGYVIAKMVPSVTPNGARRSNRPDDYVMANGRVLPRRWLRPELAPALPVEPLRWVVGIADRLGEQLAAHVARLEKRVEAARFVRAGKSEYAAEDMRSLDFMLDRASHARRQLGEAKASIFRRAGRRLSPSLRMPHNLPRTPIWQRFRHQAYYFERPRAMLGVLLRGILEEPVEGVAPSFLYQRWCGLQIVYSAKRLGWDVTGDVVGALFLGGLIEFSSGSDVVSLWVEPRLTATQAERIGWRSEHDKEMTPDFLFVCGELGRRDCFVLDATLSTNDDALAEKGRYKGLLAGEDIRLVAGVPVARRPLRSWAAAPIKSAYCRLLDPQGYSGVVPLDAHAAAFPALDAWLADVFLHACVGSESAS